MLYALAAGLPIPGQTQGFTVGEASSPGITIVTSTYVTDKARAAFEGTTARRVAETRTRIKTDTPRADELLNEAVAKIRTEFAQELRKRLHELEGDGVLEVSEVSREIGRLREDLLADLERMLEAIREGHPPPPLTRDYESGWAYTQQILDYTLNQRNAPMDWGRFTLYVLAGLLFAWLISKGKALALRTLQGKGWRSMALLLQSLGAPLYMVAAVSGLYLGLEALWLPGIAEPMLDKAIKAVLAIALFWFLWGAARAMASGICGVIVKTYDKDVDYHIELFILRILRVIVLVVFAIILIKVVLSTGLTGLLTGLGIVGVALSLILRGSIENLAAAFTLFGDKPIRIGDIMIYQDHWGRVEDIGFRAVRFRSFDGHLFSIPNSEIINQAIQNVGARPFIRRRFRIGLTYDTPPDKVREAIDILKDILLDHEGQPKDLEPRAVFEAYGDYDLRLLIQYHFQPPDYWEALEFDSKVNLEILTRFAEAGLKFAYPTHTTILETDDRQTPRIIWSSDDGHSTGDGGSTQQNTPQKTTSGSSRLNKAPTKNGGADLDTSRRDED